MSPINKGQKNVEQLTLDGVSDADVSSNLTLEQISSVVNPMLYTANRAPFLYNLFASNASNTIGAANTLPSHLLASAVAALNSNYSEQFTSSLRSQTTSTSHSNSHNSKNIHKCVCGRDFKSARWLANHQKKERCFEYEGVPETQTDLSIESQAPFSIPFDTFPVQISEPSLQSEQNLRLFQDLPQSKGIKDIDSESNEALTKENIQRLDDLQSVNMEDDHNHPSELSTVDINAKLENNDHHLSNSDSASSKENHDVEEMLQKMPNISNSNEPVLNFLDNLKSPSQPTEEKGFRCDFCSKLFIKKHKMQIHRRMHTGEKPYNCTFCGKAFSRKDHMMKHVHVHYKYRKVESSAEANVDDEIKSPLDRNTAIDNPVLSAFSGVSIMLEQQSELQTKLAALSALAKAKEIQKKERFKAATNDTSVHQILPSHSNRKTDKKRPRKDSATDEESSLLFDIDDDFADCDAESVADGKYKCSHCIKSFDKAQVFLYHLQLKHKIHGNSKFTCSVCQAEIWTRRKFESHILSFHGNDEQISEQYIDKIGLVPNNESRSTDENCFDEGKIITDESELDEFGVAIISLNKRTKIDQQSPRDPGEFPMLNNISTNNRLTDCYAMLGRDQQRLDSGILCKSKAKYLAVNLESAKADASKQKFPDCEKQISNAGKELLGDLLQFSDNLDLAISPPAEKSLPVEDFLKCLRGTP